MIKAYVTKPDMMDVICGGIDRCDVFLIHPPEFEPFMLECPLFGPINDPNDILEKGWRGEHHFKAKVLRKAGGRLLDYVWDQILDTYKKNESLGAMLEDYNRHGDGFKRMHRYPQPQFITDRHAFFAHDDARTRFIHHHAEKEGMRRHEWVLPINLELNLVE